MFCQNCGTEISENSNVCGNCNTKVAPDATAVATAMPARPVKQARQRLAYILLAIFLGSLGIHNFYAGYNGKAIAQLLMSTIGCLLILPPIIVWVWVIVEICIVTKDAEGQDFD